jgi:hypothetical protein
MTSITSIPLRPVLGIFASLLISLAPCHAQDDEPSPIVKNQPTSLSSDEAAKELANPNTSLASLTFRNQYRFFGGDLPGASDQSNYTMLFQPVFPIVFGTEDGLTHKLFVRPAIPFQVEQSHFVLDDAQFHKATGLGDIGFDVAYGLSWDTGAQLAFGMAGTLPTATGNVPGGNTALGPELFAGHAAEWGFAGFLLTHQWDISGWSDGDVNKTTLQPILTFLLEDGWAFGTAPIMDYNYESDEFTMPLNAFVQKTVKFGKTPTRIQLELNYYPARSSVYGPEYFIGLNITPVVPNPFQPK